MKIVLGMAPKPAAGHAFALTFGAVKALVREHAADGGVDVSVEFRNPEPGESVHGRLLVQYERGVALIVYSTPEQLPEASVRTAAQAAVKAIVALPPLQTSTPLQGRRRFYRAYLGALGATTLTRVECTYAVGKYRGGPLSNAMKARRVSMSEQVV